MRSVVDWRTMIGTGDAGPEWIERAQGVWPWQDDSWYREQSPITYVEQWRHPC
jgi:dipeptidyl aminopeptidase/acylaminoacyl peptidase